MTQTLDTVRKKIHLTEERWNLVADNFHLIDSIYKYFKSKFSVANEDPDEYEEAGIFGLINAARKYDFERNDASFSTYAITIIRRDMMRVLNAKRKYKIRFKEKDIFFEDSNGMKLDIENVTPLTTENNILDDLVEREDLDRVKALVETAPNKHQRILQMRFYEDMTFDEIGKEFNVTREQARTYYKDAIEYMKGKI